MKRTAVLLCLLAVIALSFTGCGAGEIWDDMKSEWNSLMDKSHKLHGELISDAADVNSDVLSKIK